MLNRALEVDPKSANALFNLGMLNWKVKKDPQAAIQDWELLLKNNPNHPKRAQVESLIAKVKQSE
jgi:cytochrome c-type biogenesis protein CcmH/NrfG